MDNSRKCISFKLIHEEGNETDRNLIYSISDSDFTKIEIDKSFSLVAIYYKDDILVDNELIEKAKKILLSHLVTISKIDSNFSAYIGGIISEVEFSAMLRKKVSSDKFNNLSPITTEEGARVLRMICQQNKILRFLWLYEYLKGSRTQKVFTQDIKSTMPSIPTKITRDQRILNNDPTYQEDMFTYIRNLIGHPEISDIDELDKEIPELDIYCDKLEKMAISTI
jgi:hypothetical protein